MWSHSPPSGTLHRRPRAAHPRRSRTVAAIGERRSALLESVLGATPREFESRILRHGDLREHRSWLPAGGHLVLRWAHLAGSIASSGRCYRRDLPICCAWSRTCRTSLNGGVHAAESCCAEQTCQARTAWAESAVQGRMRSKSHRSGLSACQPRLEFTGWPRLRGGSPDHASGPASTGFTSATVTHRMKRDHGIGAGNPSAVAGQESIWS